MINLKADPFGSLSDMLAGRRSADGETFDQPAFERLRHALLNPGGRSPLDFALLVRHALVHENGRRRLGREDATLAVPVLSNWPCAEGWARTGCETTPDGAFLRVRAQGWHPCWMPGAQVQAVDAAAAHAQRRRFFIDERDLPVDPFLSKLGRANYRSTGQCRASRALLTAPPGATLVVGLPTGEGKSLLFQLVDQVGFRGAGAGQVGLSVTLVIVPTITLALDHEKSARRLTGDDRPRAYVGDEARKSAIRDAVREGSQGLVFAAPEAACTGLRGALLAAAAAGRLAALVVDEAHLVDGWGTDFRTDFQMLAGLWTELSEVSRASGGLRTLLLSATLSQRSVNTLRSLFSNPSTPFGYAGASALRPEIDYWVAPRSDAVTRQQRCVEALLHLPRPAILYVTRVQDALDWADRLGDVGFRSLQVVHGDTPAEERDRILVAWHAGTLDLVVATSAFGMGVDYAHVRSVVHACIPETLDRFYQEVGRGGRDGCASLSLLLPAHEDLPVARRLNEETVISVDRGLARWRSMFDHSEDGRTVGERVVSLEERPGFGEADIDMLGLRHRDWNARTLALMARAGLIRLGGKVSFQEAASLSGAASSLASEGALVRVAIADDRHRMEEAWRQKVEPLRRIMADAKAASLKAMLAIFDGNRCTAGILEELYRFELDGRVCRTAPACGGCPRCRARPAEATSAAAVHPAPYPWPGSGGLGGAAAQLFDDRRLALVFVALGELEGRASSRRLSDAFQALARNGLVRVLGVGDGSADLVLALERSGAMLFHAQVASASQLALPDLPPGPEFVAVSRGVRLLPETLAPRPAGRERILLVPEDQTDPNHAYRRLHDVHNVPGYRLTEFFRRVLA